MPFWRKDADSFEVEAVGVKSAAGVAELRQGPILRQLRRHRANLRLCSRRLFNQRFPKPNGLELRLRATFMLREGAKFFQINMRRHSDLEL